MVMWWVMFREVIHHVLDSWFKINERVFLFYPVLHIHLFGPFLSNCSSENAFGRGVVCFDCCWLLGKTEFMERDVEGYTCFPIAEQSPDFCFGHGCHHLFEDSIFRVDWAVCW